MIKRFVALILVCLCSLHLNSCGYGFKGSGSVLPPDVRRIKIPLAENNTSEPGLALVLTEALQDHFERYGVVSIVESTRDADAILYTRILDLRRETETVTSRTDTALQLVTIMTIGAQLKRVTGPLLWADPSMSVSKSFGTSSDVVVTSSAGFSGSNLAAGDLSSLDSREISRGQEREALEDLSEKVAQRIYDEAVAEEF